MEPQIFLNTVVRPGLDQLATHAAIPRTLEAERFLIAIALQESDAIHRYQHSPATVAGPARGFWQFEPIGVLGVMTHRSVSTLAREACLRATVVFHETAVHRAIEGHDGLATAFARLLVRTHPEPLPVTAEQGWNQYLALWRPGRPRLERWSASWNSAAASVRGQGDADAPAGTV